MSTLYIVATPIGNLEDITLRALRVLGEADLILAEDTRVTKRLLERHGIQTQMKSYHQRSQARVTDEIIALLSGGGTLALVTDAGTPGIADPGNELIARIVEALPETHIEPIPGPSSLTAALSVCGFPTNDFVFLGFLPHKKGRQTLLNVIAGMGRTVVLLESPHRIGKLISALAEREPLRRAVVVREMTKVYESVYRGTLQELTGAALPARGEYVVVLAPQ